MRQAVQLEEKRLGRVIAEVGLHFGASADQSHCRKELDAGIDRWQLHLAFWKF
jgi:hypothetical protein